MSSHFLDTFHYCPRCGSARFEVNDARSKRCADCGFVYYHNAACSTVAVVFNRRGELLVTRRAMQPARGTLDLPGGFVEPNESATEGVVREVKEETGADARVQRFLFSLPNTYEYAGFTVHTTDLFFACVISDETVVFGADDAAEAFWLPPSQVRPADFGLASIRRGVELLFPHAEQD